MTTDERIEKVESQLARIRWINGCLIVGVILCLVTSYSAYGVNRRRWRLVVM